MTERERIAFYVNGQAIAWQEILTYAKFQGGLVLLQAPADVVLICQEARRHGITVSDVELQQAADQFRAGHGLHAAEDTRNWINARYLSFTEFESMLEAEALTRKLRQALTEGEVERYFAVNRLMFEAVVISQLVVRDEGVARELRAQIVEEGKDFHVLARQHSIDEATRLASGYLGSVKRQDLAAPAQAAIFGARPGEVVGPVKADEGWKLIKIEALQPATLNDAMREEIKLLMFNEWLAEQRSRAQISAPPLPTEQ